MCGDSSSFVSHSCQKYMIFFWNLVLKGFYILCWSVVFLPFLQTLDIGKTLLVLSVLPCWLSKRIGVDDCFYFLCCGILDFVTQ